MRVIPVLSPSVQAVRDSLISGSGVHGSGRVDMNVLGDPAGTITWSARNTGAAWITLTTTSGHGNAPISWVRSAFNLRDGVYIDTITVSAPSVDPVRIIDTLVVKAPVVDPDCVARHLFGASCLDAIQLRWLDLAGNRDGQYNLGDLLLYLARPGVVMPSAIGARGSRQ
jgi:hypothetical protein